MTNAANSENSLELYERLVEENKSDGLPVLVPDDSRIDDFFAETPRDPADVISEIPANFTELTVEKLAEVSAMAGCRAEYFPVVIAIFEALSEWNNLRAVTSTTGGFWIATIVNGPIADELDINCGTGLFGPGYRANATIGRAISLTLLVVGGVYPGEGTKASHGYAGRYTNCFGEKGASKPWSPLHADIADMAPEENAVTVVSAHAPHITAEGAHGDREPEDILKAFARQGAHAGACAADVPGEVVFVLCDDHIDYVSDHYSKEEFKEYMYKNCQLPHTEKPLLRSPGDALVVTAGGENISSVIHTFTYTNDEAVTKPIER
ncbi:hypothetical protein [Natronorubrum sp. FCH18a]|uniref:hypothetical protein n=1 Tax=Natronorubrum sp. FCH18a TaxID=3447018 RepID=UPI003F510DC5